MTHAEIALERAQWLVLARLATKGDRPPSVRRMTEELFRFVEAHLTPARWEQIVDEAITDLHALEYIDARRVVTPSGRRALCAALGVSQLPPQWSQVTRSLIPALALGLPAKRWTRVDTVDKLRARIIRQRWELAISETPTSRQAADAHAWRALGVDDGEILGMEKVKLALVEQALGIPLSSIAQAINAYCWTLLGEEPRTDFNVTSVRRALLERSLDVELRADSIGADKAAELLSARALGATRSDINVLRRALVTRWMFSSDDHVEDGEPPLVATEDERPAPLPLEPPLVATEDERPPPLPLEPWAREVQSLANTLDDGRYGPERVFIAAVWRSIRAGRAGVTVASLEDFKARLVEANRAGLLRLHRADLVGAMDPALVRESETRHLNATFHFIESEPRRRT